MPENFTRWVKDNEERIACASSLPYFLADNSKVSNGKYRYLDSQIGEFVNIEEYAKRNIQYLESIKVDKLFLNTDIFKLICGVR